MIYIVEMFCANCDGCNKAWEHVEGWVAVADASNLEEDLSNADWIENDEAPGTWYFPDCYQIDDEDVTTFKTKQNGQAAQ